MIGLLAPRRRYLQELYCNPKALRRHQVAGRLCFPVFCPHMRHGFGPICTQEERLHMPMIPSMDNYGDARIWPARGGSKVDKVLSLFLGDRAIIQPGKYSI